MLGEADKTPDDKEITEGRKCLVGVKYGMRSIQTGYHGFMSQRYFIFEIRKKKLLVQSFFFVF